jgi:hypothetical protein
MLYCLIDVLLYFICYSKLLFYSIVVCVNLHLSSFQNLYTGATRYTYDTLKDGREREKARSRDRFSKFRQTVLLLGARELVGMDNPNYGVRLRL